MSYTLFIPTAGIGSRLGPLTKNVNKSLLSIAGKPVLSHIIDSALSGEKSPQKIVVALGYKGELVLEFLQHAYPEISITTMWIDPYVGPKSGLGETLRQCRELLQSPFVFAACDGIIKGTIPDADRNWIGVGRPKESDQYRLVEVRHGFATEIIDKQWPQDSEKSSNIFPYAGICGVADVDVFWSAFESAEDWINDGEAAGLKGLCGLGLQAITLDWYDVGNRSGLAQAREELGGGLGDLVILEKENEDIWFCNDKAIKFHSDTQFIKHRATRANHLKSFVPPIEGVTEHMLSYKFCNGKVLSRIVTPTLQRMLLQRANQMWEHQNLTEHELAQFSQSCQIFYRDKTYSRTEEYFARFGHSDDSQTVNNCHVPSLSQLFELIPWSELANGKAVRFHGDFHYENIVFNEQTNSFMFLDWRQDFAGNLVYGDQYYDLAKLMHGLLVPHPAVADQRFVIQQLSSREFTLDIEVRKETQECYADFLVWLRNEGLDTSRVKLLAAIILLNIAVLHHEPYAQFLFYYGKYLLTTELESM